LHVVLSYRASSISELITDVDDYIEFYSHQRFHETLAYKKTNGCVPRKYKIKSRKEGDLLRGFMRPLVFLYASVSWNL
jgi:hypothetical protein